jgi:hypothetical protein
VSNISYHSKKFPQHNVILENMEPSSEEDDSKPTVDVFAPSLMCVPVDERDAPTLFREPCPYLVVIEEEAEKEGMREGDVCLLLITSSASRFSHVTRLMEAEKDPRVVESIRRRGSIPEDLPIRVYYIQKPIQLREAVFLDAVHPSLKELYAIKHAVGTRLLLRGLLTLLEE